MLWNKFIKIFITFQLLLLPSSFGFVYTKRSIQEKQEKYDKYVQCVNERSASMDQWKNQRPFKALIFQRDASIKLQCFHCLSPDEEDDIEEIWKPNDSFLGRTIRLLTEKIKKIISNLAKKEDKEQTSFRWEYLKMEENSEWIASMSLDTPDSTLEKARNVVNSFLKREKSKAEIGDHYEMEIFKANHNDHTGFYRCMRIFTRTINGTQEYQFKIEQFYFVDVLTSIPVIVREAAAKGPPELSKLPNLSNNLITVHWDVSKWGDCNRCGEKELGEQRRKIQCMVKPKTTTTIDQLSSSEFVFFTMFESVPCWSSLLPLRYRKELESVQNVEEFRSCQSPCFLPDTETRIVKDIDENGKEFVADELPPSEFSIAERLPPLKPSVRRKTISENEGNSVVLDCGHNNGDVFWRKNFKDLYSKDLHDVDSKDAREYINADGQLVIQVLRTDDAGYYSCFTTPNVLQRTFRLIITQSNPTEEYIGYIKIVLRYTTGLLIAVLVIRTILKTNANVEQHHRTAPKK